MNQPAQSQEAASPQRIASLHSWIRFCFGYLLAWGVCGATCYWWMPPLADFTVELIPSRSKWIPVQFRDIRRDHLLGFSPDGSLLMTGSIAGAYVTGKANENRQAQIHIWDALTGCPSGEFDLEPFSPGVSHGEWAFTAAMSPDKRWLAAHDRSTDIHDGPNLRLWSIEDGLEQWRISLDHLVTDEGVVIHTRFSEPTGLEFTPDGQSLWVILPGHMFLIDRVTQRVKWHFKVSDTDVAFLEGGQRLACFSYGWSLFDIATRRRVAHFPLAGHDGKGKIRFADDGRIVAVSLPPLDRSEVLRRDYNPHAYGLRLIDAATWMELAYFPDELLLEVPETGQSIATLDRQSQFIRLRDAVSGNAFAQFGAPPDDAVWELVRGPGRSLWLYSFNFYAGALLGSNPSVQIRDLQSGASIGTFPCDIHAAAIDSKASRIAFIHDGQLSVYSIPFRYSFWKSVAWGWILATSGGVAVGLIHFCFLRMKR